MKITKTQLKKMIQEHVRRSMREQNQPEEFEDDEDDTGATLYRYVLFIQDYEYHDGEIWLTDDLLENERAFIRLFAEETFIGNDGREYTIDDIFKDYFIENYEKGDRSVGIYASPSTYNYRVDLYDIDDDQLVTTISGEIDAEWYWGY